MRKLLIILFLLLSLPAFAQVDPIESFDNKNVSVLNDQLENVDRRIYDAEQPRDLTLDVTGILPLANGGLGSDFSGTLQGQLLFFSGSNTIKVLGTGTNGQFLKSQGATADLAWGDVTLAHTLTKSGSFTGAATISIASALSNNATYRLAVEAEGDSASGSPTERLILQFDSDSGANYFSGLTEIEWDGTPSEVYAEDVDGIYIHDTSELRSDSTGGEAVFSIDLILVCRDSKVIVTGKAGNFNGADSTVKSQEIYGVYYNTVDTSIVFSKRDGSNITFTGNYYLYKLN